MEPIQIAEAIILVGAFVFMVVYEVRYPARAVFFVCDIVLIFDGVKEGSLQKTIGGVVLALLIICMNTVSRKIVAVERPRSTVWQMPFLVFLFVCYLSYYRGQDDIDGLGLQVLVSLFTTGVSFIPLKACFFDFFGWLFFLINKKEMVEIRTVIRSTSRSTPYNRRPGPHYYHCVFIMKDKREVQFSKEYEKQFPKSRRDYDYRRTVYYKKSKFFNCIQITRIK